MVALPFSALVVLLLSAAPSLSLAAPTTAGTEVLESQVYNSTTALVERENPAVVFTSWSSNRQCGGSSETYTNADGPCYSLPGQSLKISSIAATCRTFLYGNRDCTGTEIQAYPGTCYDVRTFYTLKTFCH